jgi:hypothetical protein
MVLENSTIEQWMYGIDRKTKMGCTELAKKKKKTLEIESMKWEFKSNI